MASKARVRFSLFLAVCLVVDLLAFALKEASFLRDLDSPFTVSRVSTGLR